MDAKRRLQLKIKNIQILYTMVATCKNHNVTSLKFPGWKVVVTSLDNWGSPKKMEGVT